MAPIDSRWFSGTDILPELFAENLAVASFGYPVNSTLGKNGWDGKTVVAVGLELSPDNRQVRRGQILMRGHLSKDPAIVQAAKLWDRADKDVTVTLPFPQAAEFDFSGGTMASDYLTSGGIRIQCARNGQEIQQSDWAGCGIGAFCLRLFLQIIKGATASHRPTARYTVLFFPMKEEEMVRENEMAKGAGWPGIKILEGDAALFPAAPENGWGCPIYPILSPGANFATTPNLPSSEEMRFVISKIMGTARQPVACATGGTLKKKWDKIRADQEEYTERIPTTTWPEMPNPPAVMGKFIYLIISIIPHFIHKQGETGERGSV